MAGLNPPENICKVMALLDAGRVIRFRAYRDDPYRVEVWVDGEIIDDDELAHTLSWEGMTWFLYQSDGVFHSRILPMEASMKRKNLLNRLSNVLDVRHEEWEPLGWEVHYDPYSACEILIQLGKPMLAQAIQNMDEDFKLRLRGVVREARNG